MRRTHRRRLVVSRLGAVLVLLLIAGSRHTPDRFALQEWGDGRLAMGTVLELRVVGRDEAAAHAFLERSFRAVEALEAVISSYREASPLSALNRAGMPGPRRVPRALGCALRRALALGETTGGAFDVTVGPLLDLYRAAARAGVWPSDAAISAARGHVGGAALLTVPDCERVVLGTSSMRIDFGGIGKGLALAALRDAWRERPAGDGALLSFGQSSLVALGHPVEGGRWRIALRSSRAGTPPLGRVALRDLALGFSSSLGQTLEIGGRRASHVVDPRTGRPVAEPVEALVVGEDAAQADALSTALVVLGARDGLALVERMPRVEALIVDAHGRRFESTGLRALAAYEPPPGAPGQGS